MCRHRRLLRCLFGGALIACASQTALASERALLAGTTPRPAGPAIQWALSGAIDSGPGHLLLVAQGSGCAPARQSPNVAQLAQLLPDFALLTVEKYGVRPDDRPVDPMADCADDHFAHHTVSQRVADAAAVLADLRKRGLWRGDLFLFGGSEGGAVVSILAHEVEGARAAVVFSTGTGLTMAEFLPMAVPPPVAERIAAVIAEARANPDSAEVSGGNSYKWWADIADRRLSDDLLRAGIPVLIVHGANDRAAPVAAARAARDAFVRAGAQDRLTYWELADRDHQMVDTSGASHMRDTLARVAAWIRDRR